MKIQFCSDLHLEFPANRTFLSKNRLTPEGEILVLAGDIVPFHLLDDVHQFFDFFSDHYSAVYWIPGNHEYYGADILDKPSPLHEKIRSNFFLVNNISIVHGGVKLLFSTLWTQISRELEWDIERSVADFSAIRYRNRKFTGRLFSLLHKDSLSFIQKELQTKGIEPIVMVTHHVPTLKNYPLIYANSPLNQAFAVELSPLILESRIACWIYGHNHFNIPDFTIGNTTMLTNQLGYVHKRENNTFRTNAIVEV